MTEDRKKGIFSRVSVEVAILIVLVGTFAISILKAVYPQTAIGEYLTLVTVCSIILAIVLHSLFNRWKNQRG